MNVVIVGYGKIGKVYFQILKKIKKIKKIYLIDKYENKKKDIHTIKSFDKRKEINNINYAFVCSPSHLHYEHAAFFLKRKIPVLIEKPFVLKIQHAYDLIKLSKRYKTNCCSVFQNRYNKSILRLKKIFQHKKNIKKVFFIDMKLFWKRDKKYYNNGWHGKYKFDGGVLTNQSIHMLDALIYIFGKVKNFTVISGFNKKKLEAEDLISLQFKLQNGILVNYLATTRSDHNYEVSIDVLHPKKRYRIEGISMNKFFSYKDGKKIIDRKSSEDFKSGHGIHHKDLIIDFLNNDLKDFQIQKNLHSIELIHSIYIEMFKKLKYFEIKKKQSKLGI